MAERQSGPALAGLVVTANTKALTALEVGQRGLTALLERMVGTDRRIAPARCAYHCRMIGRLVILIVVACAAGCNSDGKPRWPSGGLAWPFAPVSIRVHPLTHLDRDDDGQLLLICHIALLDTWNESVRGLGELHVSFFGPGSSRPEQNAQWTFDLNEIAVNEQLYDPATRTYRLQLGNLPPWVSELETATDDGGRGTIMAELTTVGAEMEPYTIRGEATLRP